MEEVANKLPTFVTEEERGLQSSGLSVQNLETLKVDELHPLSPEVISRQATVNIGTIGHVAHGKSTVVKAISGVQTVRYRNEIRRNITIKLGYANAKIYKCPNEEECPPPSCYRAFGSSNPDAQECPKCGTIMNLMRHVSFVDCPGHDILMATMLNGAAVMDAALLLIAANEPCPQPQTAEHLAAVDIMQLRNLIILQNKIDLVRHETGALDQYRDIRRFIKGTNAADSPIVPISAQLSFNIDALLEYMVTHVPVPQRLFTCRPRMIVIRSFDVNKAGWEVDQLKGGVAGGSIIEGVLRKGQEIEIRPGIFTRTSEGVSLCSPILTTVLSLFAEENELQYAVPGGLIGVGTKIDPALTRQDRLVGQVIGDPGHLPDIFSEIEISYFLLRRLLGVKGDGHKGKVQRLQIGEVLMVNIGSMSTGGRIVGVKDDQAKVLLTTPVCTQVNEKLALSRRVDKHWRLIGWGQIRRGVALDIPTA